MSLLIEHDRISKMDEAGNEIGHVLFQPVSDGIVEVVSTYVDEEYRGRGIGPELMDALSEGARKDGIKLVLSCPYAKGWFIRHPEDADLLLKKVG